MCYICFLLLLSFFPIYWKSWNFLQEKVGTSLQHNLMNYAASDMHERILKHPAHTWRVVSFFTYSPNMVYLLIKRKMLQLSKKYNNNNKISSCSHELNLKWYGIMSEVNGCHVSCSLLCSRWLLIYMIVSSLQSLNSWPAHTWIMVKERSTYCSCTEISRVK